MSLNHLELRITESCIKKPEANLYFTVPKDFFFETGGLLLNAHVEIQKDLDSFDRRSLG